MAWKKTRRTRTWSRKRGPSTKTLQRTKAPRRYNWVNVQDDQCCPRQLAPRACAKVEEGETQDAFCFNSPVEIDCNTGAPTTAIGETGPVPFGIVVPNTPDFSAAGGEYQLDDITLVKLSGHILLQPFWVFTEEGLNVINSVSTNNMKTAIGRQMAADRHYFLRAGLHKDAWLLDEAQGVYNPPVHDPWQTDQWTDGRFIRMWQFEKMPGQLGGLTTVFQAAGDKIGCVGNVSGGLDNNVLTDGSGTINTHITTTVQNCLLADTQATNGIWLPPVNPIRLNLTSRRRLRFRESEGLTLWLNYGCVDYTTTNVLNCAQVGRFLAVGFHVRTHLKALIETS